MLSVLFLLIFSLFLNKIIYIMNLLVFCMIFFFMSKNYSFYSFFCLKTSMLYLDFLSFYLMFLSLFLFLFIFLLSLNNLSLKYQLFKIFLLMMLMLCFSSKSTIYFFIFFEISFLFMFLMMMFWGVNPERMDSLNYLIMYSLVGSVPLLFTMMKFQSKVDLGSGKWLVMDFFNSLSVIDLKKQQMESLGFSSKEYVYMTFYLEKFYRFFWFFAFLIKFPIYGLHLWLPKAHVESPVYGSMILAGIMLKMGVFGMYRYLFYMKSFFFDMNKVSFLFMFFCFSMMLVKIMCVRQYDAKSFIAYSSIVHMTLIAMVILSNNSFSIIGSIFLCLSHGFCSSALFLNFKKFYIVSGTRKIFINRGFIYVYPLLCFVWFSFCSLKCSVPFSLNFISELLLICSGVNLNLSSLIFYMFKVFFCGLYSVFLYLFLSHGKFNSSFILMKKNTNYFIYLVLMYHFYLVFFFILFFDSYLSMI